MSNSKAWYITLNDSPGGIYSSQVIDVVKLLQQNKIDANLLAIIPLSKFLENRKKIKNRLKSAIVVPAVPKLKYWALNVYWIRLLLNVNNSTLICRNIFAANIGIKAGVPTTKVIFDGRGAITAEQDEYEVYAGTGLEKLIRDLELKAILDSDRQIAVSKKLVQYWKEEFGFKTGTEVVIPCSLSGFSEQNSKTISRADLGWADDDIILIYSGSAAGWQSWDLVFKTLDHILKRNKQVNVLFLAKPHETITRLEGLFGNRVVQKWIDHNLVPNYLDLGDYGLLIREKSTTNKVASPVKFAEYLFAGLKVLISEEIGDYSKLVLKENIGHIILADLNINIEINNDKSRIKQIAFRNFSKESREIKSSYLSLF